MTVIENYHNSPLSNHNREEQKVSC